MGSKAKLSSKGQITIPKEVRQRLGLKQGDQVSFEFENGRTFIQPVREEDDPFAAYEGALGFFKTKEEVVTWVRNLRDDDDSRYED
ncbi:MAG: AbrB/MazE/SpoVT family DNA-binding domain-containing protein [Deinococcota bacterium]